MLATQNINAADILCCSRERGCLQLVSQLLTDSQFAIAVASMRMNPNYWIAIDYPDCTMNVRALDALGSSSCQNEGDSRVQMPALFALAVALTMRLPADRGGARHHLCKELAGAESLVSLP